MYTLPTVKEVLGTKFGNERIARVMNRVKLAYQNGTRGEKLDVYLKGALREEGVTVKSNSINPEFITKPPIIYPHNI